MDESVKGKLRERWLADECSFEDGAIDCGEEKAIDSIEPIIDSLLADAQAAALATAADYVIIGILTRPTHSEYVNPYSIAERIRALSPISITARDEVLRLEARIDVMIWCTGAMSLNTRDNYVIQKAIAEDQQQLAAAKKLASGEGGK